MRFSTVSAIHLLIAGIALGAPLDQTLKQCTFNTLDRFISNPCGTLLLTYLQVTLLLDHAPPLPLSRLPLPLLLLSPLLRLRSQCPLAGMFLSLSP